MTDKDPLICCFGGTANKFSDYINSDAFIASALSGTVKTNGRAHCYAPNDAITAIMRRAVRAAGIRHIAQLEVFAPKADYPAHTDTGEVTLALPLTAGAALTVDGFTLLLDKWGLYSFNDGVPHTSRGAFAMAVVK